MSTTEHLSEQAPISKRARRGSKLPLLLLLGVVTFAAAWAFRFSPWAREYPLKKATLAALRAEAARSPRDPVVHYYLGTQAYNEGNLAEALSAFERATALDPRMARAHTGIALIRQRLGQLPAAFLAARQAVALAPQSVDAQYTLAMIASRGSSVTAAQEFEKLTRMAPKRADAWHWLAVCQGRMRQTALAIPAFKKAAELEPKNALYQRDLGKAYTETNQFEPAREALDASLALDPEDPEALYYRGKLLLIEGGDVNLSRADEMFSRALLTLREMPIPDHSAMANLMNSQADAKKRQGNPKAAWQLLKASRHTDPTRNDTLFQMADVQRRLGNTKEARRLQAEYDRRNALSTAVFQLSERIKQDLKNPKLRLEMARLYRRSGDLPRSENQYLVLLGMEPKNSIAVAELASVRAEMSRKKIRSLPPLSRSTSAG